MTATAAPVTSRAPVAEHRRTARSAWPRLAPSIVAAALAAAYVIVAPPSIDLAAHLFRAQLFRASGFALWNNLWYDGHDTPGYSVLFPAVSAALTPQIAAALAGVGTAALFETLALRHYGRRAWVGAVMFGAATAINLYTGRLALAFGALPALGAIGALDRRRAAPACLLAVVTALCSPVAALFTAIAAGGCALAAAVGERAIRAAVAPAAVALAALAPVAAFAVAFPEDGTEPFALTTLLPLLAGAALLLPTAGPRLRAGIAVYTLAAVACYLIPSPVGSNIARLGTFLAAPLAALVWWRRRTGLLAVVVVPLLYIGWQAPVRDVATTAGDPAVSAAYYRPLLAFLHRQPGVFRIEIPLTRSHWEAYWVARSYPLARGWERQLDTGDNPLFYGHGLTPATYAHWLHDNAIRFVALPDAALDYSAEREAALIRAGLPYLRPVMRSRHWRVYAVTDPTPLASGPATVTAMGAAALTLTARTAGTTLVRVHYSPYWALIRGDGCVSPAGAFTRVMLRRPGDLRLAIRFSPARIGARTRRCSAAA